VNLSRLALFFWALTLPAFGADQLIIASPHWEGVQYEFGRSFAEHYKKETGRAVDIHWRDLGGTSQIEKAIDAAYKATPASCGIDIFFGGGIDPFLNLKAKGHLEPYAVPDLDALPADVRGVPIVDPDRMYYGAALASFGVLENLRIKQRLNLPEVRTWEDLTRPEFLGWVDSADPRKSGSVHMIYEILLQFYGWDRGWAVINQMSGNIRTFFQASSGPTKEVAAGDVAEAVTIDINGLVEVAELGPENVRFVLPPPTILTPDCVGILKGAPNLDVAHAFVAFVMSAEGQALWMKPVGSPGGPVKYPISRMGVWPPYYAGSTLFPLDPFAPGSEAGMTYDSKLGSRRWGVVNDLLGQTVIDVHARMVKAWRAIVALPEAQRAPLVAAFSQPFVTEAEALDAAAYWRTDKLRAGRTMNAWMAAATERYDRLAKEAETMQKGTR
jgi:ABC-type Fe3+ transport system substrate-binding protein